MFKCSCFCPAPSFDIFTLLLFLSALVSERLQAAYGDPTAPAVLLFPGIDHHSPSSHILLVGVIPLMQFPPAVELLCTRLH